MTLKIDRQSSGDELVVRLIGNLGVEHLPEVTTEVRLEGRRVVIDVSEVTLISIEGIRLLNACEDDGIVVSTRRRTSWSGWPSNVELGRHGVDRSTTVECALFEVQTTMLRLQSPLARRIPSKRFERSTKCRLVRESCLQRYLR
jgi:hypothetical protein